MTTTPLLMIPGPTHVAPEVLAALAERIPGEGPDPHGPGALYLVADWPYGPKRWISDPAFLPSYEVICGPVQRVDAFVLDRCEEQPPIAATFTLKP
jgi:hypothetical protein